MHITGNPRAAEEPMGFATALSSASIHQVAIIRLGMIMNGGVTTAFSTTESFLICMLTDRPKTTLSADSWSLSLSSCPTSPLHPPPAPALGAVAPSTSKGWA